MVNIATTLGALLIGGLAAAVFSGVVTVQTFAYFKYYSTDPSSLKVLVLAVSILDSCHTIFVGLSLWDHLIAHFGHYGRVDVVPWSMAMTIALTAILTFLVHCFLVHRIYRLSRQNLYIAVPLGLIACLRLCFACVTTVKMITLRSLRRFVQTYTWSFTAGLALSCLLDVLITALLFVLLMKGRKRNSSMCHVLDLLMLYAFEHGALTSAATVVSMICWLAMPSNLIFMGLHFVISKLYANSLLATLNARKQLQVANVNSQAGSTDRVLPIFLPDSVVANRTMSKRYSRRSEFSKVASLRINVEESTIRTIDDNTIQLSPPPPTIKEEGYENYDKPPDSAKTLC